VSVMKMSARAEYALRGCIELARAGKLTSTAEDIAQAHRISRKFLQNILGDLRRAGYVRSSSSRGGGYRLALPADQISVADILRAIDGPLVCVNGVDPNALRHPEAVEALTTLWIAIGASVRAVLEDVSLHDLATGRLPLLMPELADEPGRGPSSALNG
jgi:Rrf2 family protein